MKKIILIVLLMLFAAGGYAQVDPPAGYTVNWGFRMWNEGDYPGGDSVNQNWIDLDSYLKIRDQRIDSILNLAKTFAGIKTFSSAIKTDTIRVNAKPYLTMPTGLNFLIENDLGALQFFKNYSTTILEWDETDGLYWQTAYPFSASELRLNNININTNGTLTNMPYKNGRNVFTNTNVFNYDSVLFPIGNIYLGDATTYGGAIVAKIANDVGIFGIYKTNLTTPLLEWDENDGLYWQTAYPFSASELQIAGTTINTKGTLTNVLYRTDTCNVDYVNASNGYKVDNTLVVDERGYFRPISSADSNAPNNSIYYSTDQSALVYKDAGGVVHALY